MHLHSAPWTYIFFGLAVGSFLMTVQGARHEAECIHRQVYYTLGDLFVLAALLLLLFGSAAQHAWRFTGVTAVLLPYMLWTYTRGKRLKRLKMLRFMLSQKFKTKEK